MKSKGFTLIELMIVIAIVGIIAAVLIPYVQGHTGVPTRQLVYGDQIVVDQPAVDPSTRGDSVTCIGGISYHRGTVLILNGETIKCGERK